MKFQLFWKWRSGLVAAVILVAGVSRPAALGQATNTPPGLNPETNTNTPAQAAAPQEGALEQASEESDLANAAVEPISTSKPLPATIRPAGALAELIRLVNSGVEEGVLLAYVTNSAAPFNLGVEEIIYLNDVGVPGEVVTAMIQRDQALKELGGGPPAPAAPEVAAQPEPAPIPPQMAPEPAPDPGYVSAAYAPPDGDTGYATFYNALAPYGTWVNVAGYGPCWQPTVVVINPTWQPYCDGGRWIYSDCGWYWLSGYSWGWGPFHYGRWFRHRHYGWCWAPDTVWGPSWVCWRYTGSHCGWAPLPPGAWYRPGIGLTFHGRLVNGSFGFGLSVNSFTFVGLNHFNDPHPHHYALSHRDAAEVYRRTAPAATISGSHDRVTNGGIPASRVTAATRTHLPRVRIQTGNGGAGTGSHAEHFQGGNTTLSVYRPHFSHPSRTAPAPGGGSRGGIGRGGSAAVNTDSGQQNVPGAVPRANGVTVGRANNGPRHIGAHGERAGAGGNTPAVPSSSPTPTTFRGRGNPSPSRTAPVIIHETDRSSPTTSGSNPNNLSQRSRTQLPSVTWGRDSQRTTANGYSVPVNRPPRSWAPTSRQETSPRPRVSQQPQVNGPASSPRPPTAHTWTTPGAGRSSTFNSRPRQYVAPTPSYQAPRSGPMVSPASPSRHSFSSPAASASSRNLPRVSQPVHSTPSAPGPSASGRSHSSSGKGRQ